MSTDPRDNRLRTAALVSDGATNILIDPGPDFRQQMLRAGIRKLDAIVITHEHNDHVIGIDDVRPFNFASGKPITVYALARVAQDLKNRFQYIFGEPIPGLPRIDLVHIDQESVFTIENITIQAIGILHGRLPILGFRFGHLAYITDMKTIVPSEKEKLNGVQYLVVNALQEEYHPTHMNLEEALDFVAIIRPEKTWLTHSSHLLGKHKDVEKKLPNGVYMGYDGLEIS